MTHGRQQILVRQFQATQRGFGVRVVEDATEARYVELWPPSLVAERVQHDPQGSVQVVVRGTPPPPSVRAQPGRREVAAIPLSRQLGRFWCVQGVPVLGDEGEQEAVDEPQQGIVEGVDFEFLAQPRVVRMPQEPGTSVVIARCTPSRS